jgi:dihydropteroate synthase
MQLKPPLPSPPIARHRPLVMGILNVTPDSFSDGGRFNAHDAALAHALAMQAEGADIIDIGGESTRPGAEPVPLEEELQRVVPLVAALRGQLQARLSVDTRKAEVMRQALTAGADIINDVSALTYEPASLAVVAASDCQVVLMHGKGDPRTMQLDTRYDDAVEEVYGYLQRRIEACVAGGIARERLIVDPGIGFGKNLDHNLELLARLDRFRELGVPLLLGASRKRFIGALTGEEQADRRLAGSLAAALAGAELGVAILRVHAVAETRQALAVWQAIRAYR